MKMFNEWFMNAPKGIQWSVALGIAVTVYLLFRYFIHAVNKSWKEVESGKKLKKLTWKDNLRNMARGD